MAGHPLRPATRRRLGRPLPHQQADRPRAHPTPQKLSPTDHAAHEVYSVLDPVSQAYPKVQGRSPTCYSPVRHSCTPKGLTVRLACVKHAASVRPEPESNSPNKNHIRNSEQGIRIRKIRPSKPEKNWQKNHATPQHGGTRMRQKNNNKQKPPNTLLSSQTTHPLVTLVLGNPASLLHLLREVNMQFFDPCGPEHC